MSVTTLNKVADYLLRFARDHGDLMTQLKLQKMVFYADAWYMALHDGEELIADKFEAWVHGPVARALQEEPWMQARGSLPPSAICETYIDKDLTARFYREMMDS
ncbi:Panacea domain-containing protein [Salmonella enterica]